MFTCVQQLSFSYHSITCHPFEQINLVIVTCPAVHHGALLLTSFAQAAYALLYHLTLTILCVFLFALWCCHVHFYVLNATIPLFISVITLYTTFRASQSLRSVDHQTLPYFCFFTGAVP